MGNKPSEWGTGKATSLTTSDTTEAGKPDISTKSDITSEITDVNKLFDNNSLTKTAIKDSDSLIFDAGAAKVSILTLTNVKVGTAPEGFKLEISNDGETWTTILEKEDIEFMFDNCVTPFVIPEEDQGNFRYYKLTLSGGTELAEVEFIGEKSDALDEPPATEPPVTPPETDNTEPDGTTEPPKTGDNNWVSMAVIIGVVIVGSLAFTAITVISRKIKKA
jgi:hypothetical protein